VGTPAGAYFALPRPALFGHRGVRGAAPENTLAAIRLAREAGADGVEIDVRPCRDGDLVVVHDVSLARVGGVDRNVASLSLAELSAIRVGGEPIPTLAEVIAYCRDQRLALNVELKRDVPSRSRAVIAAARALRNVDLRAALVVSSFDPLMLAGFRLVAPNIPTALLLEPSTRRYRLEHAAHRFGVAVHPARSMVTREWLERWHRRGLRVIVWTVNDPDEIRTLCDIGVDGIISDDPATARRVMR
jgi:glycerophosphoryl diester phosphodiesterase